MEEYTEIFVWGSDTYGQLGLGIHPSKKSRVPRQCSFNILIHELSCGEDHTTLISQSGYVYTMGSNSEGRLGLGSKSIKQSSSPCLVESLVAFKATKVSCGWGHTVVLCDSNEAFAWGVGEYGALGSGSTATQWAPSPLSIKASLHSVSCGSRHTAILTQHKSSGQKRLFLCGAGEAGQLGTGRREKELIPVLLDLHEDIKQVSCGVFHTGILTESGEVYMMGGNSGGQLGLGSKKSCCRPEKVEYLSGVSIKQLCCSDFTAALTNRGQLYVWGLGSFGECLLPFRVNVSAELKEINIGPGFGMAVDIEGNVMAWGSNAESELGIEERHDKPTPTIICSLKGKKIKKVACGGKFCVALGADVTNRREVLRRYTPNLLNRKVGDSKELINKSFEEAKIVQNRSVENVAVNKVKSKKLGENLPKEYRRFKHEIEKEGSSEKEMGKIVEDLKAKNLETNEKNNKYKEQLRFFKQGFEEYKKDFKMEVRKIEDKYMFEIKSLKDQIIQEKSKAEQCEFDLLKAEKLKSSYESSIGNYKLQIDDLHEEIQKHLKRIDSEKGKLQSELDRCYSEIRQLNTKNESLIKEKSESHMMFEDELLKQAEKFKIEGLDSRKTIEKLRQELERKENEYSERINADEFEKNRFKQRLQTAENKFIDYQNCVNERDGLLNEKEELLIKCERLRSTGEKEMALLVAEVKNLTKSLQEMQESHVTLVLESQKSASAYTSDIEKLLKENRENTQRIDLLRSENNSLNASNEKLNNDLLVHQQKYNQLLSENSASNHKAETFSAEINKLTAAFEDSNSSKETLIHDLSLQLSNTQQENADLNRELASKDSEVTTLEQNLSTYMHENNFLKQSLQDLNKDLEVCKRMQQDSEDLFRELNRSKSDIEKKYEETLRTNRDLKAQVIELERKNREIFQNLEKDLNQKAHDYKQRTMHILSSQRSNPQLLAYESESRSRSPFLSQPKESDSSTIIGNTAAHLLQSLDRSPKRDPSQKPSTTPTKESLKSKIATLLQTRSKLATEPHCN